MNGEYLGHDLMRLNCSVMGLESVPVLSDRWPYNPDLLMSFVEGASTLGPVIREGVVVRPIKEEDSSIIGRKILKVINPEYLLRDNTDFH